LPTKEQKGNKVKRGAFVIARSDSDEAIQSGLAVCASDSGLLRCARNDAFPRRVLLIFARELAKQPRLYSVIGRRGEAIRSGSKNRMASLTLAMTKTSNRSPD
jgi:hypothetical protein